MPEPVRSQPERTTPPIEVRNLVKQVSSPDGTLSILSEVSFDVAAGEALAILGPSGSGKTTLLALLAGLDDPSAGEVRLFGQALGKLDEDERAALRSGRVGFVFQDFNLLPRLTAEENARLAADLGGTPNAAARAREALAAVGLSARARHLPQTLSGGEQQRVAIARAFAPNPRLLFADEPTGNLDAASGARAIDLLFALRTEHGTTLVLATHDERIAERCSRRLLLDGGVLRTT
jgi:putative ABC transport system ATP-binding protein